MYKYCNNDHSILRIRDNTTIPFDLSNGEYVHYLAWIDQGNTPEAADPTPLPDYSALRATAFINESDPLFFKEQRQEVPAGTWLAKVNEIKARWPQV